MGSEARRLKKEKVSEYEAEGKDKRAYASVGKK